MAAILKTRKRKLGQSISTNNSVSLTTTTDFHIIFKKSIDIFTSSLSSLSSKDSGLDSSSSLPKHLQMTALNFETSNELNARVLTQTQICNILYS